MIERPPKADPRRPWAQRVSRDHLQDPSRGMEGARRQTPLSASEQALAHLTLYKVGEAQLAGAQEVQAPQVSPEASLASDTRMEENGYL